MRRKGEMPAVPLNPKDRTTPLADQVRLLKAPEVAEIFRVDPKTVAKWARLGKLDAVRTVGGHRRYPAASVLALLSPQEPEAAPRPGDAVP